MHKKTVLLHSCCAPCSTYPVEYLLQENFNIFGFFSNSNIHPQDEYELRLAEYQKLFNFHKLDFKIDQYSPEKWFEAIKGYENEPEKGERCRICIYERLKSAALFAKNNSIEYICTSLTVSPHKNAEMIFNIGKRLNNEFGIEFLELDFKKKGGFNKAQQLAINFGFYIQKYCGCSFSKRKETCR